ncbi:MAG TPA: hypothetical protein VGI48_07910 [Caldimonas sp.]|jgi:hypothetical protein
MVRPFRIAVALAGSVALPAFAHFTGSATPHWHAGDAWGVLAVIALTAIAAWLDRRFR